MKSSSKSSKKNVVYFSVTSDIFYQQLALQSIRSLRYYSSKVKVFLFVFGEPLRETVQEAKDLNFELVVKQIRPPIFNWSLKWISLADLREFENVIYLDVDTFIFGKVESLFLENKNANFIAAREFGTVDGQLRNGKKIPIIIRHENLKYWRAQFQSRDIPIWNSSVMIFRKFFHLEFVSRAPVFMHLLQKFFLDPARNPIYPKWRVISEEVAASIVLGQSSLLKYEFLDETSVVHYSTWKSEPTIIGPVVHIGCEYIVDFHRTIGLDEQAELFQGIARKQKRRQLSLR